jgi:hypothetical protein
MRATRAAYATAALLIAGCDSPTSPGVVGAWGGPDVSLVISPSGGALSYSCGAGTIDSGWSLTPEGVFSGVGTHMFGGGPVPPDGHPSHPARYSGRQDAGELQLTVIVEDLGDTLGPYRLVRDGPPVSERCL